MVDENRVRELYVEYNTVIKPLIAEVEARMEQFPLPIFNEIRALHDHISRCYSDNITDAQIEKELEKGKGNGMLSASSLTATNIYMNILNSPNRK